MGIALCYFRLTLDEYADYRSQQQEGRSAFAHDCDVPTKPMRGLDVDKAYRELEFWVKDVKTLRFLARGTSDSQLQGLSYGESLSMFDPDEVKEVAAALRPLREMVSAKIWRQMWVTPDEADEMEAEHHYSGMSVWDGVVEIFEEAAANGELIIVYYR